MLTSLKRWRTAQGGAIAVEFALIAPVMILMFFGAFELSRAIDCRTRVVGATASVADLVAQSTSISSDDAKKILCAAKGVIYPYPVSGTIQLTVTSIVCSSYSTANSTCTTESLAKADGGWSIYTSNSAARTTLPTDLQASMFPGANSGVVMAEMTYTYTSPTTQFLAKTITMHATSYSLARAMTAVAYSSGSSTYVIADCAV